MRILALAALAILMAGCSQPKVAMDDAGPRPDATETPWSLRLPVEGRAPGGELSVRLADDVQGLRVLVTLQGGAFADLSFAGPGTCAEGLASPQGSAVFLPGTVLQVDGHLATAPQRCGDVARGEHELSWTLSAGTFSGEVFLQGRVPASE